MLTIDELREEIKLIDAVIIEKLAARKDISIKIGELKLKEHRNIVDLSQEKALANFHEKTAEKLMLPQNYVKKIFKIIIEYSRTVQTYL